MENATSSCGSQDSNSATGRCRWFKPRASARHPYQTLSAVAQSRTRRLVSSRPTSSPDTSQFDAILPANTRQPLGRQLIPKTHGRFILAQASHCGSSPSSADPPRRCRIMATLTCVTLLFAVGRASTSRPSTCEPTPPLAPASLSTCPSHEGTRPISLAMQRGLPDASRIRGWEGGSQIDLIHVSDVQLTDFEQWPQNCQRVCRRALVLTLFHQQLGDNRGARGSADHVSRGRHPLEAAICPSWSLEESSPSLLVLMRVRLQCNPSRDRSCRSVGFRPRQVMPARAHESTILALTRMCGVCSQPGRAAGRGGDGFQANWGLAGRLFWVIHLAWHLAASADGFGKIPRGLPCGGGQVNTPASALDRCCGVRLVFSCEPGCSPSNRRIEASTPCPASLSAGEPSGRVCHGVARLNLVRGCRRRASVSVSRAGGNSGIVDLADNQLGVAHPSRRFSSRACLLSTPLLPEDGLRCATSFIGSLRAHHGRQIPLAFI